MISLLTRKRIESVRAEIEKRNATATMTPPGGRKRNIAGEKIVDTLGIDGAIVLIDRIEGGDESAVDEMKKAAR